MDTVSKALSYQVTGQELRQLIAEHQGSHLPRVGNDIRRKWKAFPGFRTPGLRSQGERAFPWQSVFCSRWIGGAYQGRTAIRRGSRTHKIPRREQEQAITALHPSAESSPAVL